MDYCDWCEAKASVRSNCGKFLCKSWAHDETSEFVVEAWSICLSIKAFAIGDAFAMHQNQCPTCANGEIRKIGAESMGRLISGSLEWLAAATIARMARQARPFVQGSMDWDDGWKVSGPWFTDLRSDTDLFREAAK